MECHGLIFAGFGFRKYAELECFLEVLNLMSNKHKEDGEVVAISTISEKARYSVFKVLSKETRLKIISLDIKDITKQKTISFSENSMRLYQTGSLAEASALAAAGKNSRLLGRRVISTKRTTTCAFAKGLPE